MSARLDELLRERPPTSSSAVDRARAAMRQEVALKRPARRWRTQAAVIVAVVVGVVAAVAGALLVVGNLDASMLAGRMPLIAALLAAGAFGSFVALRPLSRPALWCALATLVAATGAIVSLRGSGAGASSTPEWVCTATHLAVGILPLLVTLRVLTGAAPSFLRSAVAGLAIGVTGAAVGELACGRDWRHVLLFHVTAWLAVAAATVIGRRALKTRSFAP